MKKTFFYLVLGTIGGLLALRWHGRRKIVIHFVEEDTLDASAKNFGEFPPDIPETAVESFSL